VPEPRLQAVYPRLFDSKRARFYAQSNKAKLLPAAAFQHASVSITETQAVVDTPQRRR
jgi:hypothetical protein